MVTTAPVLKYYDPKDELTLQSDASQTGLGAALMQNGQHVTYASRALTDSETRCAQIEKELLSVIFGLERFHQYTYGRRVNVQTDHKPLEMIVLKPLHRAPKRLQRMLMRLQTYDVMVSYHQGKEMYLADTLSRAYLPEKSQDRFQQELETVNMIQHLPITPQRLQALQQHTADDPALMLLKDAILNGWPDTKPDIPKPITPYFDIRDELSIQDGFLFKGVSWPSGLAYRTQVLVLATECGFESRP